MVDYKTKLFQKKEKKKLCLKTDVITNEKIMKLNNKWFATVLLSRNSHTG